MFANADCQYVVCALHVQHTFLLGQGPVEPSSTNKPLAMRVVEDALAYSKKPPVI